MAHNIHLPWTLLSSHLKYTHISRKNNGQTNLFLRNLPTQGAELMHFSRAFTQTITSFSSTERAKYPNPVPIPLPKDTVISEEAAQKISKTVKRYRITNRNLVRRPCCLPTCNSKWPDPIACPCPLATVERTMQHWIDELDCSSAHSSHIRVLCCCWAAPHSDTCELAKTLLLYGEIEPLLRLSAHPDIKFEKKWMFVWDCNNDLGFSELMRCCLMSYLLLNAVYLHPECWDLTSRKEWVAVRKKTRTVIEEDEVDYRKMISWMMVMSRCTGRRDYDVHTYPHRLFFGIGEETYDGLCWQRHNFGVRHQRPTLFSDETGSRYLPSVDDIETVILLFRQLHLPTELSLIILQYADFKPERRLPIPNDPFHPTNAEELRKYLSWCWKVLVWCDVFMSSTGRHIDWLYEVTSLIKCLWSSNAARPVNSYMTNEEEDEAGVGKLQLPSPRNIFI